MSTGLLTPDAAYEVVLALNPTAKEMALAGQVLAEENPGETYQGLHCDDPKIRPNVRNAIAELMRVRAVWDGRR